jgi:hypothetical protein
LEIFNYRSPLKIQGFLPAGRQVALNFQQNFYMKKEKEMFVGKFKDKSNPKFFYARWVIKYFQKNSLNKNRS